MRFYKFFERNLEKLEPFDLLLWRNHDEIDKNLATSSISIRRSDVVWRGIYFLFGNFGCMSDYHNNNYRLVNNLLPVDRTRLSSIASKYTR